MQAIREPDIDPGTVVLSCQDVTKEFSGVVAVDDVSLSIESGEWVSIVGPNGAGKTTLLNILNGFYKPTSGTVNLLGEDITSFPPFKRARRGLGRTFQGLELDPEATVLENIWAIQGVRNHSNPLFALVYFGPGKRTEVTNFERVEEIVDYLELWEYRNTPVKTTPVGVRRRVDLARSLVLNPSVLLLDELTSGLTYEETYDMLRFIVDLWEENEFTIVMIEHDLEVVTARSDRLVVMNQGSILASGPPDDVVSSPEVVEVYTGVDLHD
jgi:branched-chain amino acid transport system ATP-binding protein